MCPVPDVLSARNAKNCCFHEKICKLSQFCLRQMSLALDVVKIQFELSSYNVLITIKSSASRCLENNFYLIFLFVWLRRISILLAVFCTKYLYISTGK